MNQQEIMQDYPMTYPTGQMDHANLVRQTDPSVEIERLEHNFRGEVWDEDNRRWVSRIDPLMTEEGVFNIITSLNTIITNNSRFANLSDNEITRITHDYSDELTEHLSLTWKKYQIKKANLTPIVQMCSRMVFMVLKRAMNNGERRFMGQTTYSTDTRVQHINPPTQAKGKGFLRMFGK